MLVDLADQVLDVLSWRADWNRTWSPVSYWLAAIGIIILIISVVAYGADAWAYLRGVAGVSGAHSP